MCRSQLKQWCLVQPVVESWKFQIYPLCGLNHWSWIRSIYVLPAIQGEHEAKYGIHPFLFTKLPVTTPLILLPAYRSPHQSRTRSPRRERNRRGDRCAGERDWCGDRCAMSGVVTGVLVNKNGWNAIFGLVFSLDCWQYIDWADPRPVVETAEWVDLEFPRFHDGLYKASLLQLRPAHLGPLVLALVHHDSKHKDPGPHPH